MTEYRGVDVTEVLQSMYAAKKFIDELNLGPATRKWFEGWEGGQPYGAIRRADSNYEAVRAIAKTGARTAFQPFQDIFAFHGMMEYADLVDESNDGAADLYAGLSKWGAFQSLPPKNPLLDEISKEVDSYLIISAINYMFEEQRKRHVPAQERGLDLDFVDDYLQKLGEKKGNSGLADWLDSVLPVITLLKQSDTPRGDNDVMIAEMLAGAPRNGRFFLKDMFGKMTGLFEQRGSVMGVPRPIQFYAIELRDLPTGPTAQQEAMTKLRGDVTDMVRSFNLMDEAFVRGPDFHHSQMRGRPAIFFDAMPHVAQDLANRMPEARVLIFNPGEEPSELKPQPGNHSRNVKLLPPPGGMPGPGGPS
ncbi:MAG TPA: hypothetical protein VL625_04380 [Patescibacteria group bacterium]|nr:hypothetical protein [Patescibacteria group bacterium]